jgi:hypothetical protein
MRIGVAILSSAEMDDIVWPWLILAFAVIVAGWVWILRDPLLRSWRTVTLLSAATILLLAGGLVLPLPVGLAFGWVAAAATILVLVRYPDRFSSISPDEWHFADAFGAADNEAVKIAQLGGERMDLDGAIRRLEGVRDRMLAAQPPDQEWMALKEKKVAELSTAISLLREASVDEAAYERLRKERHETVSAFKGVLQSRARFWR